MPIKFSLFEFYFIERKLEHAAKEMQYEENSDFKAFYEMQVKVTLPEGVEIIYLEDVAKNMPADCKSKAIRSLLLPSFMLEKEAISKIR